MIQAENQKTGREKIFIVVPVYNHAGTLRNVVQGVLAEHDQVLVVDDGSTEPVAAQLDGLAVTLIQHEQNQGKGAALKTAAAWGLERGMTHMISLDADGQHHPEDLPQFFAAIAEDPEALYVGHRDFSVENIPGSSRFGRKFSNFWLRVQTGIRLKDTQSGFRAYPLLIFKYLNFWTSRYNFEVEVMVRAAWAGVHLKDVDIRVYYPPADERVSHFHGFLDNWRLSLLNTHLTMRSVLPWPHRKVPLERENDQGDPLARQISLLRPLKSLKLLLGYRNTPQQLALAVAVGIFLGAVPLLFCHTLVILFVSGFFRLNKIVSVAASQLCMPPVVPALCIEVGFYLRNQRWLTEFSLETLGYQAGQRFLDWLLGSLVLGPLLALVLGLATYVIAGLVKRDAERV